MYAFYKVISVRMYFPLILLNLFYIYCFIHLHHVFLLRYLAMLSDGLLTAYCIWVCGRWRWWRMVTSKVPTDRWMISPVEGYLDQDMTLRAGRCDLVSCCVPTFTSKYKHRWVVQEWLSRFESEERFDDFSSSPLCNAWWVLWGTNFVGSLGRCGAPWLILLRPCCPSFFLLLHVHAFEGIGFFPWVLTSQG